MEELRTEFDKFIKEWQEKGYSYDTLYAWMKQRILDYDSSRVELPVGIVKSGNEVTDLGVDYDGAIEAGKDGWQCGNCGKWNRKGRWVCKHCVDYDE